MAISLSPLSSGLSRLLERPERRVLPFGVGIVALALYLTTLSDVHTYDALSYIRDVDQRAGFFFHPHHLLYSPTGWLFWQTWRLVGYAGNSELPLKVLNSLVGVACALGVYHLVFDLTRRWWAALTAAGLLLFNYGFWYFSVEVEVYILALGWLVAALALLIELVTQLRPRTAPLLGLCLGLAALYHQTNALLVPVVLGAMLLSPQRWRACIRQLVICGSITTTLVALGYGLVGFGYNRYQSLAQFREWMFFFVNIGWWGQATRDRWTDLGSGLANSISTRGAWPYWVAVVGILVLGLPSALRAWPRVVAICALWIAVYGGFFAWWEGDNIEFWIATLLPLWLLTGLCVSQLSGIAAHGGHRRWRYALALLPCILPVSLAWHNYPIIDERGDARLDLQRHLSAQVRDVSTPNDLIVEPGGVLELYLPYYEQRQHIATLNTALIETQGDVPAALERLREKIDAALHAGVTVIVGNDLVQLPTKTMQRYPVTQAQLDQLWQPYRPALQPTVIHEGAVYFWRLPSAPEVARGGGWHWQTFSWGWQGMQIQDQSFDHGWCFNPLSDPALVSPLLNLQAAPYQQVRVTMQSATTQERAQLFFAGGDGAMTDEHSVTWQLEADGLPHSYTIPLVGAPGWDGTITRLRLDPISVGDGTGQSRTCIQQVELMP